MSSELNNTDLQSTPTKEFLADADKQVLESVKMKRALAIAHAENAELAYNNVVLQLTIKYKLNEKDVITEQGQIVRGNTAASAG